MSAALEAMEVQPVSCPGCGRDEARSRYRLTAGDIVTCRHCTQSYVSPRASSQALAAKLQQWASQDVVDAERLAVAFDAGNLGHYGRLLRRLERHAPRRGRLLDVGCSTGAFLTVAREAGWSVAGLEVGQASSAHARDVLGLDVQRASIYDCEPPPAGFDAVAFLEVIEHLERPAEALQRIHALLAPGGHLLLTTPNFDSLYRRLFGSRWWVVNCEDEHIVLFTRATLEAMLRAQGFDVLETRIRGIDVQGMLRQARQGAGQGTAAPDAGLQDYYEGRSARVRLQSVLARVGLLRAARGAMRALDATFAWRLSPTYAWGEQLIVVARRREPSP